MDLFCPWSQNTDSKYDPVYVKDYNPYIGCKDQIELRKNFNLKNKVTHFEIYVHCILPSNS